MNGTGQAPDAFEGIRETVLAPTNLASMGAGSAYQAVAQSAAIAIQDATENLRNMSSIGSTAIGVAMAQYLATGKSEYKDAIESAQKIVSQATKDFSDVGQSASLIVNSFPTGAADQAG